MRLRFLLATVLILTLHVSTCIGGLFTLTTAFAAGLGSIAPSVGPSMTPAYAEALSCASYSPVIDQDDQDIKESQSTDCSDPDGCVKQAGHALRQELVQAQSYPILPPVGPPEFRREYDSFYHVTTEGLARAGPLYEESSLLAHALIKRE